MLKNNIFSILQYNVNNSKIQIMISLFEFEDIENYDILIIQKFWKNSFQHTTNNKIEQQFELIYMSNAITRICLLINKKITKIEYTHTFHNKNLISLKIQTTNNKIVNVHNIYNSCKGNENVNVIFNFKKTLQENFKWQHVVIINFNFHHFNWERSHVRTDVDAYEFIITMKKFKLKKITSIELITWNKHNSENIIDFTCMTTLFKDNTIKTNIVENMNNYSDHFQSKWYWIYERERSNQTLQKIEKK